MFLSWQTHGKNMANNMGKAWQTMANHGKTWQQKNMAKAWQNMAKTWQAHGKNMAKT